MLPGLLASTSALAMAGLAPSGSRWRGLADAGFPADEDESAPAGEGRNQVVAEQGLLPLPVRQEWGVGARRAGYRAFDDGAP